MTTDPWVEALRKALLERGIGYTDDGKYFLIPNFRVANQPPEAAIDILNAVQPWSRVRPTQKREWIRDLKHTIERLLANDSTDAHALRTVFWLRLHGVVVDLRQEPSFEIVKTKSVPPKPGSDLEKLTVWVKAVEDICATLTENELLWAEYRRHVEAHVYQGAYEPQLKNKSERKERYKSKYTGLTYDVCDLDRRLGEVLAAHNTNETAIAMDFADRLREPVARLGMATEAMFVQT